MIACRLCALLLILALGIFAQTATPPNQLRGVALPTGTLFIVLPSGMVAQADLGPGLELDLTGPRPVLKATLPPPVLQPVEVNDEVPTPGASAALNFALAADPLPGSLKLWRNGIRMKAGLDYTLSGRQITFIPAYSSDEAPVLLADYKKAP